MPSKAQIEFITVAVETCSFLEQAAEFEKEDFSSRILKLFPLIYLKFKLLETTKSPEFEAQRFVTEFDYERIRCSIFEILQEKDDFLDVNTEAMQLSESPILTSVSEMIADVYQELKDYVLACQFGDEQAMENAFLVCAEGFKEHWGEKLLKILLALHRAENQEVSEDENF